MSKAHRGRPLKSEIPGSGRGKCPFCKRTGIKLLYEAEIEEKKILLCKQCNASWKAGNIKNASELLIDSVAS